MAAQRLFTERIIEAVNLIDIAKEAKASQAAAYRLFENLFSASLHLMLAAITRCAVGLVKNRRTNRKGGNTVKHLWKLALCLTLIICLGALGGTAPALAEAIDGLTYNAAGSYYEIPNAAALTALAAYVNGGNVTSGKTFKQTADIDMQGVSFTPIGNGDEIAFCGTYDGDGYVIKNISHYDNGTYALSGLFGLLEGTVRNVNLKDCSFTGRNAGGIAGESRDGSSIQNCNVLGGTITGTGNAQGGHFGGIVGYFYDGTVDGCFTTASFSGGGTTMGPVVGMNNDVTNSYYVNTPGGNSQGTQVTVYTITLGDGVTMTGNFRTVGRTAANTCHFGKENDDINLTYSGTVPAGCLLSYTSSDVTVTDGAFTMPAANVTVNAAFVPEWTALQNAINNAANGATIKVSDYAGTDKKITATPTESALTIPGGKTVTLDLDGCTLDRGLSSPTAGGNVITVNGTLTVTDSCSGGTITGGHNSSNGGGVFVAFDWENNVKGTFIMSGGAVSNNSAESGGGVYCDESVTFTMSGGAISNNSAGSGGGVCCGDDVTFIMSGGTISGNTASFGGGGINGGNIVMSGNASVTGNTNAEGKPANIPVSSFTKLNIAGDLDRDARIGVTSRSDVSINSPFVFTSGLNEHGSAANFTSDQGYTVALSNAGEAQLAGSTVTFYHYGRDDGAGAYYVTYQTAAVAVDGKVSRPADPTYSGLTFGGWYTDSACMQVYDFDAAVTGNLTLYPRWQKTLTDADVTLAAGTWTYSGAEQKPAVTVTGMTSIVKQGDIFPTGALTEGTDYTVAYTDNVNAGTATVTVTGGHFNTGTVAKTFTIAPAEFSVTVSDADNGIVTVPATVPVGNAETTVTLTVTPEDGYTLENLRVTYNDANSQEQTVTTTQSTGGNANEHTFTMPLANVAVTAAFTPADYTINMNCDTTGGTVTAKVGAANATTAHYNDTVTLTVSPSTGYELDTLTYTVEGGDPVAIENNQFTMPADNVAVSATFKKQVFTITFQNDDGTVLQSGAVEYGATPAYTGAAPVKEKTAQYTYAFAGWSPAVAQVTGAATYTATYTGTVNKYTVTWQNEDGTVIDQTSVEYGVTPIHAELTKAATEEYTYTFSGWTPAIVQVTGNATYKAAFNAAKNSYTVTWQNEDGTVIAQTSVEYGTMPTHADPAKAATEEYTYTFNGWTPNVAQVTGNATYKATFKATKNSYIVTWQNEDGTVIDTTTVEYGTVPTHADPTKAATTEKTYTFSGWTPSITAATGEATYKAVFADSTNSYTITWQNEDGTLIDTTTVEYGKTPTHADPTKTATPEYTYTFNGWVPAVAQVTGNATYKATFKATKNSYTVTWQNEDGTVIDQTSVEYGATPTHAGPAKAATKEYTYTFSDWTPAIVQVTGNATYTATYTGTVNKYTVTWKNEDGTVIDTTTVEYGKKPTHADPTKAATQEKTYVFSGWTPSITAVTGDAAYKAVFSDTTNSYTVTWQNEDGTEIDKTIVEYGKTPTHAAPTKAATQEYTYTFDSWTPAVAQVTGNATYKATFKATKNSYTVTWQNEDGTEIDKTTVEYGATPTHADPTKAATADKTYSFSGWTPTLTAVTGNATYKATFTSVARVYAVACAKSEHGSVSAKAEAAVGGSVTLTVTPEKGYELDTLTVKQGNANVTVTNNTFIMPAGNVTVTAAFKQLPSAFGTPNFTLPAACTAIEESAFEGLTLIKVVDASHCASIGKNAFKGCTNLNQIRLPKNCAIDANAFSGCGTIYVYAPAGGTTETYCGSHENLIFVGE